MLTHFTYLLKGSWRYATGLHSFLSKTLDLEEAKSILTLQLQNREESFLLVLEKGIYDNPRSPYRRLLEHAGFGLEAVRSLVREHGLEGALSRLYDEGVYVSLDEFKGRAPIRRLGLEFSVRPSDFANPLLTVHYTASTSGSRGSATPVEIDFDHLAHEAASSLWNLHASGLLGRPILMQNPGPPSLNGLRLILLQARQGLMSTKWLTSTKPGRNRQSLQGLVLFAFTRLVARMAGKRLPRPEYTPDPLQAVNYLADCVRNGTPAVRTGGGVAQVVRTCLAAEQAGLDISGTVFRGAGEPITEGKVAVIERAGAVMVPGYGMQEVDTVALGCGNPSAPDDMHFLKGKLAVVQRPVQFEGGEFSVEGLFYTTVSMSAPRLMLNVETGDYAVLEDRDCGCAWQNIGFTTHIHHVRSYEKLTSGGVMFMGTMLHELLEETLPSRFGGNPLDYQMVEEEEDGVTRVNIVISPRVGPVDEKAVIETVFKSVGFADWSRRQANIWRQNNTLRVQRREPYTSGGRKVLPLHVLSSAPTGDPTGR